MNENILLGSDLEPLQMDDQDRRQVLHINLLNVRVEVLAFLTEQSILCIQLLNFRELLETVLKLHWAQLLLLLYFNALVIRRMPSMTDVIFI
jgi:hypothetical protein